ncbi:MerR family transcriptional regulator [Ancylobacter sonchi]|nr:MerR family transcriptional regulator [Ancylobacter sonchi]
MEKSPDAFRTISEVADELDLPQHVLRFWETKFPQIRPLKRGGGRRYYRPDDVELLRGIQHLLYGEGYTIRGVQRILKEEGPRYVQAVLREAMEGGQGARAVAAPAGGDDENDEGEAHEGKAAAGRSSLSGFFGLLPGRRGGAPRDDEPERAAARKPARRRPSDDEPNFLDMPLLPDIEPHQGGPRHAEPRHSEPRHGEPRHIEPRFDAPRTEPSPLHPREAEPRFDDEDEDDGPSFPFRGVGGEPEPPFAGPRHAERYPAEPPEPFPVPPLPAYVPPAPVREEAPSRLTSFRPLEGPEDGLSDEQVRELKAALADLQECYRLLMEARRGEV